MSFILRWNKYDISQFVDVKESNINYAIPFQEIAFRFQKPDTFFALNFEQINNKIFGDLENTTTESPDVQTTNRGSKYIVTLPFGKMIYERLNDLNGGSQLNTMYGWSVDKDQNPTNIKPLILNIRSTTTGSNTSLSYYNNNGSFHTAKTNKRI